MAALIKGMAIVWGIGGVTFTAGIVSATNAAQVQSVDLERSADKVEVKDANGECVSQVFLNKAKKVRITVVPSHASVTATAITSLDAWTPSVGTTLTLADASGAIFDGSYNCTSVKQRRANNEAVMADIEMELYEANDVTTATT
jgi:hypothetical protein